MKKKLTPYRIVTLALLIIVSLTFIFPFYWILTGAFKLQSVAISIPPEWFPKQPTMENFVKLFKNPALKWFINTVFVSAASMILVCLSASLAGYAIAKKRFYGQTVVFSLIICAMALPKQVVLVPLVRIMDWLKQSTLLWFLFIVVMIIIAWFVFDKASKLGKIFSVRGLIALVGVAAVGVIIYMVALTPALAKVGTKNLTDTLWAVVLPTVGWPFGVFMMKQFSESIPTEILEAARIDGAGELKTFVEVVCPIIKPGFGALAIFTFINTWNDYFLQLIMLRSRSNLTISLGIATLQAEFATNYGLQMAGAALGAVPIVLVFLMFQKYFTQGITMGAVKG